ncbi:hypothetical protein HanXRQr2_Chr09g0412341 [Helianthus annuus]|uniref:Uncharacterized protein n=1 Tax=Helianthus annuus TaxID=4232 RepID=A0A9K3NAS9_HELAN|nr:hypothetical protein HanXRQr2_Chr09g0412341 [Helianthus annuus]
MHTAGITTSLQLTLLIDGDQTPSSRTYSSCVCMCLLKRDFENWESGSSTRVV